MKLHDELVVYGDSVYDISVDRGYGTVIKISSKIFEVRFDNGKNIVYNYSGKQKGKSTVTLYWNKPFILPPNKNENISSKKQEILLSMLDLMKSYKEYL